MHFTEFIYQTMLFAATFFIFNKIFTRFLFKGRPSQSSVSLKDGLLMGFFFSSLMIFNRYLTEKYLAQPSTAQVQLVSGQAIEVPDHANVEADAVVIEPLNVDFHLADVSSDEKSETSIITTEKAIYTFDVHTATLRTIDLAWPNGQFIQLLKPDFYNFLLAFDTDTPENYTLVSSDKNSSGSYEILFSCKFHGAYITKKFTVYDYSYKIDVSVSIDGFKQQDHARLIVPMPALSDNAIGIVNKMGSVDGTKIENIDLKHYATFQKFWFEPKLFGLSTHYFAHVLFKSSPAAVQRSYVVDCAVKTDDLIAAAKKNYCMMLQSEKIEGQANLSWSFYCGPKSEKDLAVVSPVLQSLLSYGIFGFLVKPCITILDLLKEYLGSYGWAIILLTLLIKILMIPFALRSERTLKAQAEFEKKRQYLQQKYKHDKVAFEQAMTDLLAKQGLPILSGCLPMLLNIPVFFTLNKSITFCAAMYQAPFLWIHDLTLPDPYYVLSAIVFLSMVFVPQSGNVAQGPRQMFSRYGFALFLATMTSCFSAALGLFFVVNTMFGLIQNPLVRFVKLVFRV